MQAPFAQSVSLSLPIGVLKMQFFAIPIANSSIRVRDGKLILAVRGKYYKKMEWKGGFFNPLIYLRSECPVDFDIVNSS